LLAIFPTGFNLPAAAAIWETKTELTRDVMEALLKGSLVEIDDTKVRLRLHDLVRQFCDGKLSEAERDAAMIRYAKHYTEVGREAQELYLKGGNNLLRALEVFDRERNHIEAAYEWLANRRDASSAAMLVRLVNSVVYTGLLLRFHPGQSIRWCEGQREAAKITKNRAAEANALGNLGNAYAKLGDVRKAIEFYQRARIITREIGDRQAEGNILGCLGIAYTKLDEGLNAIEFFEQQLLITYEIGDRRGEGIALCNIGIAYAELGEIRKAIEHFDEALVIDREIGNRRGEAANLFNSALALDKVGERVQAISRAEAALNIYEVLKIPGADKVRAQLEEWKGRKEG
jgi:tetratricopeptide (TPR) repeat protein